MNDPNALDRLQRKTQLLQDRVTLLEEENAALAGMLRERGVDVHRPSHIHVDLPAALTEPAAGNAAELALMSGKEKKLFEELSTGDAVLLLLLSEAMVDVGRWFWRSRLWLYATPTELVAFAAGRHAFVQRIPFKHIQESLYNHVTGELVLAPDRKFARAQIALSPAEAYQFLAQIYGGNHA